ncbi:anti-sigma factor family protein [Chitinophaga sp. Ak27]|uniref:anti-sigma factor family protein n=1 Tax=Chitinophaga sp. Ak27 TaxID=2726116 RepID=UPI00145D07DB|nr:hypothetical protein [Chitinophaga sp. Ak27]NLU94244.1 hypothetical protein [Chitinophaga sp. Ak27]
MSNEINISNYESFLLSYIDGELNEAEQAALELFLQEHPQFRQELELLEGTRLVPDEAISFSNKSALYRTGVPALPDIEELMLGYIDGELTAEEEKALQEYLEQHPAARKELALLQATKLTPDTGLVFTDKTSLYRSSGHKTAPIYRRLGWVAAAAAVVAGLVIWLLPTGNHPAGVPTLADKGTITAPKPVVTAPTATPIAETPVTAPPVATPTSSTPSPLLATNHKKLATRERKTTTAVKTPQEQAIAATSKTDAPVMSQLPPQRNSVEEVVAQHRQQTDNTPISTAIHPEVSNEPMLAANTKIPNSAGINKIAPAEAPQPIQGELIMSVSGSDSKLLDKVTNVAKFFSRKRNKQ